MAPGPGRGECTAPRAGPGDMPLALRLSDGLGHARAAALDRKDDEFLLTSCHGADHTATPAGDEKNRLGLRAPRGSEDRDPLGVEWMFFISSLRHCGL